MDLDSLILLLHKTPAVSDSVALVDLYELGVLANEVRGATSELLQLVQGQAIPLEAVMFHAMGPKLIRKELLLPLIGLSTEVRRLLHIPLVWQANISGDGTCLAVLLHAEMSGPILEYTHTSLTDCHCCVASQYRIGSHVPSTVRRLPPLNTACPC